MSRRQRRRVFARSAHRARRLVYSFAPLLLLLLGLELGFRLFWEPPSPTESALEMVPHPTRLWGLNPGVVTAAGLVHEINEDQLRAVPDTGAAYRVFTVGDSSVFGHGLKDPDTLHVQLSQDLAEAGTPTDVFCGAVPGYSTEQSLVILDEVGWDLDLDLIIIGSLWSDNNFGEFVDAVWMAELRKPSRRIDFFLSHSYGWRWLRLAQNEDDSSELRIRSGSLPIGWIRSPEKPVHGRRRVPLQDYAANLDTMLLQAAERGVGALVLPPCNRGRLELPEPAAWDIYFETMAQVSDRRGVLRVDACEVLAAAGLDGEEAFLDKMHPTGAANAAYSRAIVASLMEAGWPERPIPDGSPPPVLR